MEEVTFDLTAIRPMVVIPICYDIAYQTFVACLETQAACLRHGINVCFQPIVGVRYVHVARSQAVDVFLKSDCTHLFFIDSDMSWSAADAMRFMVLGTEMECLCAAYPYRCEPLQFMANILPADTEVAANKWGCIPFGGTGMGFTILQRSLLERLAEQAPRRRYPGCDEPIAAIFETDFVGEDFRGEDMNFFAKVRDLGSTVWLDPSIELGHVGEKEFRGKFADQLRIAA